MSEVSRGLLSVRLRMKLTGVFSWVAELEEVSGVEAVEVGIAWGFGSGFGSAAGDFAVVLMSVVGRLTTVDGICDGDCGGGSGNPNPNERDFAPPPPRRRGDLGPLLLPAGAADASFDDPHPISLSAVGVSFFFLVLLMLKNFITVPAETRKIGSVKSYPRLVDDDNVCDLSACDLVTVMEIGRRIGNFPFSFMIK